MREEELSYAIWSWVIFGAIIWLAIKCNDDGLACIALAIVISAILLGLAIEDYAMIKYRR